MVSDDVLIDLRQLQSVVPEQEGDSLSVTVGAGCQIKRLLSELERKRKWTLPSVGFITEQTVAGAIATGTHGSGRHSLSHYVKSVRVARYDTDTGEAIVEEISTGNELLAARCSLGCLGVILSVNMQCRSTYSVEEHFREYEDLTELLEAEEQYPLQQFYLAPWRWTYFAQHRREASGGNSVTRALYYLYRFVVLDVALHLLILFLVRIFRVHKLVRVAYQTLIPMFVLRNRRVTGPSTSQLVMEHELFRHVEIELFVRRSQLAASLHYLKDVLRFTGTAEADLSGILEQQITKANCREALARLRGVYCHHYPICVRRILPDATLISMASAATAKGYLPESNDVEAPCEDWYSITLTNYHRGKAREPFDKVAAILATSMSKLFGARLHWGKLCPLPAHELSGLYPAFGLFASVCRRMDPLGVFGNDWTAQLLGSAVPESPVAQGRIDSENTDQEDN